MPGAWEVMRVLVCSRPSLPRAVMMMSLQMSGGGKEGHHDPIHSHKLCSFVCDRVKATYFKGGYTPQADLRTFSQHFVLDLTYFLALTGVGALHAAQIPAAREDS